MHDRLEFMMISPKKSPGINQPSLTFLICLVSTFAVIACDGQESSLSGKQTISTNQGRMGQSADGKLDEVTVERSYQEVQAIFDQKCVT